MNTHRYGIRRCVLFSSFVALVALGLLPAPAHAVTTNWIDNSGGPFTTAANWDNGVPDDADVAVFDRGSGVAYTVSFALRSGADITNDRLVVGSNSVTFNPAAPIFGPSDYFLDNTTTLEADPILQLPVRGITIGAQSNDTAAVLISHLSVLQTVAATLGHVAGSSGTLTLNQNNDQFNVTGGSTADAELIIGRLGTGVLNVSAGADVTVNGVAAGFPAGGIKLGSGSSGNGTANISGPGSILDTNTFLFVGDAGTGTLNVTAGGHVENLTGLIANLTGSIGTTNISGSGSTWSNALLFVGEFGQGTLNIMSGGVVESQSASMAGQSGSMSAATVSGAGSAWNVTSGNFHIGLRGHATLSIADAAHVNSNASIIADLAGSQGTVTVSGVGSLWANAAEIYVGDAGMGTLDITGGGQVTSHILSYIAVESSSTGTVTVDGVGSSWTAPSNFYVGVGGDGTLEITGGGLVTASGGLSVIARQTGSNSGVTVDGAGSRWINNQSLVVGYAGDGTLEITGGGIVTNNNGNNGNIGFDPGGIGSVLVDGAGSLWNVTGNLNVGLAGQGTLTVQNGGMVEVDGNVNINTSSTANLQAAAMGGNVANSGNLKLRGNAQIGGSLTVGVDADMLIDSASPCCGATVEVAGPVSNSGSFTMKTDSIQPCCNMTLELGPGQTFTNNAAGVVNLDGPEDVGGAQVIESKHTVGGNVVNHGQFNIHSNTQIIGSLTVAPNANIRIDWGEPCCNMTVDVAGPITNSGTFTMTNSAPLAAGAELAEGDELASGASDHQDIILYARDGVTNSAAFNMTVISEAHMHVLLGPGERFVNNANGVVNLVGVGDLNGNGMTESVHTFDGDVVNHGQMNVRTNAQIAGSLEVAVDADVLIDSIEPCCSMVLEVEGGVTNSGEVTLKNSMAMAAYTTLQIGSGENFTNEAAGVLEGTGTIVGNVLNRGEVRPGNSTGVLAVTGDFTQEGDGRLVVEVGGTTPGSQHDQLAIGGEIALGGLVEVVFEEGFSPQPGNRFDVVTTTEGVSGKFVGAELPGLPAGMDWNILYGTSIVSLVTTIPGDYNADGNVDAADYIVWRKTLGQAAVQGLGADGDPNGTIDEADYTVWRANFGATADGAAAVATSGATGSANAAVPEPASLTLLLLAAAIGAHRRPRRRVSPFAQNRQIGNQSINKCRSCVLGVILALSVMSHHVLGQLASGVQEGDLFVGASSSVFFGRPDGPRGVFRVRDGVVTPFSLGSADPSDPAFFDLPHDVLVDSQGRVVWLAPLNVVDVGTFGTHVGLFRASGEGATPERLAIFRVGNHALDPGYPNPFPDRQLSGYDQGSPVIGLHLASNRRIEIDDDVEGGKPRVVTEEAYVMGLLLGTGSGGTTDITGAKTVSYGATTGVWDDHLPEPLHGVSPRIVPIDMVSHAGAIYSISGNGLRRSSAPLRVGASGSIDLGPAGEIDFSVGLSLFGGNHDIQGMIVDDTKIPNVPCNCAEGAPDPPHHLIPSEPGYSPMSGFQSLHYDPGLGLVISSHTGFLGPYLTRISETLLNDNADDDLDAYFYWPEAGDLPTPSLGITRMVARGQFGDPDSGIPYPLNRSVTGAPGGGGLIAVQGGSVVRVMENGRAEVLASGLAFPSAVGSFPTYSSPSTGLSVIIRVDSPVDVLLTAPDGRQIGVDPQTGLPVNDFGDSGFDSGPGEPRFFGIRDYAPGDWNIQMIGTGEGPFAVNVYGVDLDEPVGTRARMTGNAYLDRHLSTFVRLDAEANATIFPPGDFNLDRAVDAADYIVWRKSLGETGSRLAADGDGNGTIDEDDYNVWRNNFGATADGAAAVAASGANGSGDSNAAIPEPSALTFVCIGLTLWPRLHQRHSKRTL